MTLTYPGESWRYLKCLLISGYLPIFVLVMDKERINIVLENVSLTERFAEELLSEINRDDEPLDKVGRELLRLCLEDERADEFFIAICGWSVDSLLDKL